MSIKKDTLEVLRFIIVNGPTTISVISKNLKGISERTIRRNVNLLEDEGFIVSEKPSYKSEKILKFNFDMFKN
ncbi:MAG: helix-turn-helix domain-containing protein [Clostridia bacterium]|nr:helix-turn-helix domain-containing protein [Clostridia bacterium]